MPLPTQDPEPADRVLERDLVAASAAHPRIGELLLAAGDISVSDLDEALRRKSASGKRVGEELIAAGVVSKDRVRRVLRLQRRLMIAALLSAAMGQSHAAETKAVMTVTANVVERIQIRAVYQAQEFHVSPDDLRRGYVDVPVGSRYEIEGLAACLIEFRGVADLFSSVTVTSAVGSIEFGPSGGALLQRRSAGHGPAVALSYRFHLKPGVQPGPHRWPLAVSLLPL